MLLLLLAMLGLVSDTQAKQFLVETGNTTLRHDDEPNENIGGQRSKEAGSDYSLSSGSLPYPNKMSATVLNKGKWIILPGRTEILVWRHLHYKIIFLERLLSVLGAWLDWLISCHAYWRTNRINTQFSVISPI